MNIQNIPLTDIHPYTRNPRKNDEAVKALCAEWKTSYDVAKIQGIPAYVVNGKYLIMTKSIRNFDGMVNLVKELKEMK